jgi:hypothetical protein
VATIVLPHESINWTKQALECVLAHELGHVMGLADPKTICLGSIMKGDTSGGQFNLNDCKCSEKVSEKDRQAVNRQFNEREIVCKRSIFERHSFRAFPTPLATPTPNPGCQDCTTQGTVETEIVTESGQTCYYYYNCTTLVCCGQQISRVCQMITSHCIEH